MNRTLTFAVTVLSLLSSVPALAGDTPYLGTKGYVSTDTSSLVELDFHMVIGKDTFDVFGFVPELQAQYGFGSGAVGLNLGLTAAVPDQADTEYWLGAISVFGKSGFCTPGPLELCFGGQLEISWAPSAVEGYGQGAAFATGIFAHNRMNRFGSKMLVITPAVAASLKMAFLWAQAHLGSEIITAYDCDTCDTEATLTFGVAGGITLLDMLALGVGFRVLDFVSAGNGEQNPDPRGTMDLIFKLMLGPLEPVVMLSFYLDEDTREDVPVVLTLGAAAKF